MRIVRQYYCNQIPTHNWMIYRTKSKIAICIFLVMVTIVAAVWCSYGIKNAYSNTLIQHLNMLILSALSRGNLNFNKTQFVSEIYYIL